MSVAEAEAAAKQAAERAKREAQHLLAVRLLTRHGRNTSNFTHKNLDKKLRNMLNAERAARQTARNLRKAKLRAQLQSNDPAPVLIINDPPWYNLVEEELVPSPSRAKSQRRTRRRRHHN
jgi:hypothetical protein